MCVRGEVKPCSRAGTRQHNPREEAPSPIWHAAFRQYVLVPPVTPQESNLTRLLPLYDTPCRLSIPYHRDPRKGVRRPAHLRSLLLLRSATTTNPYPYK